ncbi:MAG: hypothetical protein QF605_05755, partial [Rhodospirillales bacterium]|nr:hypothetical protein [Rhodospirillales bacterium]
RAGSSYLNYLVFAIKFRFLHQLPSAEQVNQIELMFEVCESELARFEDLRRYHEDDTGHLTGWLDHDISRLESRLDWLTEFKSKLEPSGL